LARRRTWGQVLSATARIYAGRFRLMICIGVVFVPIALLIALLQRLVLDTTNVLGVQGEGETNGVLAFFMLAIATALTLFGLGVAQKATVRALVEIDQGRWIGPVTASGWLFAALAPSSERS
jgi:hypothetical protein